MIQRAEQSRVLLLGAGLLSLSFLAPCPAFSQGCIASRGSGGPGACMIGHEMDHAPEKFQASVSYRWFESKRMFSGSSEVPSADPQINRSHFIDLALQYSINPRFSVEATVPYVSHDRSQIVRRLNIARTILGEFHTKSSGFGDIRLQGNAWLLDPVQHMNGNVRLGLGASLPTGDRDAQATFAVGGVGPIPSAVIRSVDPSIQPGSGGYGILLDLYGYQQIVPRLNAFVAGTYIATPETDYTPTASSVAGYSTYSIADSYIVRSGLDFLAWKAHSLSVTLAGRMEGVPVNDLVGGSDGFRRPGYMVSVEPGVTASWKGWGFGVSAPVAVFRNRLQNRSEENAGIPAAVAGFADYQLIFNVSKRF